jgi:hypothetical protein
MAIFHSYVSLPEGKPVISTAPTFAVTSVTRLLPTSSPCHRRLKKASFLFLDEATSALDNTSEKMIQQTIDARRVRIGMGLDGSTAIFWENGEGKDSNSVFFFSVVLQFCWNCCILVDDLMCLEMFFLVRQYVWVNMTHS